MPNRVCEQMVRFVGKYLVIRVWVTANQQFEVDTTELKSLLSTFSLTPATEANMKMIICAIEKLKNIAAAEILNTDGEGILLYPDWN